MQRNEEDQSLALYSPVKALQTAVEAKAAWEEFEALKKALLVDDDYQKISTKKFIKKTGFRKIATAFGLSDTLLEQERTDREDESFMWRIVVEVKAPNGRTSIGVGICDSNERKFNHLEHDVYATCHTRAKSRAISDMVAGGAVSAEEMNGDNNRKQVDSEEITSALEEAKSIVQEYGEILFYERAVDFHWIGTNSKVEDFDVLNARLKDLGFTYVKWEEGEKFTGGWRA